MGGSSDTAPRHEVLVRHVTGEPSEQARRATASLRVAAPKELVLVDLIAAEFVFFLQSVYRQPRARVPMLLRSLLALPAVHCNGESCLRRALDLYEDLYEAGMDFPDAYLVATAELGGVFEILSFDRGIRNVSGVRRVEP